MNSVSRDTSLVLLAVYNHLLLVSMPDDTAGVLSQLADPEGQK